MENVNLMDAAFTLKDVIYICIGVGYGVWRYVSVKKNQEANKLKIEEQGDLIIKLEALHQAQRETHEEKHELIRAEITQLRTDLYKRMNTTHSELKDEIHQLSKGISKLNGFLEGITSNGKES